MRTLIPVIESIPTRDDASAIQEMQKKGVVCWSYQELAKVVDQLAQGLLQEGLEKEQPVLVYAPNQPEWIIACLAILRCGAVVVPVDSQFEDKILNHILRDCNANWGFTTEKGYDQLKRLGLTSQRKFFRLDQKEEEKDSWHHLLHEDNKDYPNIVSDDAAVLFYTSGTTGKPKGVPLSHGNLAFQINSTLQVGLVQEDDHVLLPLPLHHVYPFVIGMLCPLALGLTIVLPQTLTGPQLVRANQEGNVSALVGVPRLYRALFDGLHSRIQSKNFFVRGSANLALWTSRQLNRLGIPAGKFLLGSIRKQLGPRLKILASGGSALDPDLATDLEVFGWQVALGYGLTETSPLLTLRLTAEEPITSVGKPLEDVEIRLQPLEELENTKETVTEIQAKGPGVFSGYHNLPEKTQEAFTKDGWFRTGDLGYFDEQDCLHVTGRTSTMIVSESGENIQPDSIEEAYEQESAIKEIAVFEKDRNLVAIIVPELDELNAKGYKEIEEIIGDCIASRSKSLPSYQRVTNFVISQEALPRTRLGKVRRHLLPDHFQRAQKKEKKEEGKIPLSQMSDQDQALLEQETARQVWDWLVEKYPNQRLTPDSRTDLDLGIDSMEWLNITMEIGRRTGVELNEEAIGRIQTIRDLLQETINQSSENEGQDIQTALASPEEFLQENEIRWLEPLGSGGSKISKMAHATNQKLMEFLFQVKAEGCEHLPDKGPFILAPNHVSYLDGFALAAVLDNELLQQTYWAGWTGINFKNVFMRTFSRYARIIPIGRDQAIASSLAFGAAVLKRGNTLVWFPEGRLSRTGKLNSFKPGIGILVDRYAVPVIPVYIQGTYEALPIHRSLPLPTPIRVLFAPAVEKRVLLAEGKGENNHERIAQALHDRLERIETQQSTSAVA